MTTGTVDSPNHSLCKHTFIREWVECKYFNTVGPHSQWGKGETTTSTYKTMPFNPDEHLLTHLLGQVQSGITHVLLGLCESSLQELPLTSCLTNPGQRRSAFPLLCQGNTWG